MSVSACSCTQITPVIPDYAETIRRIEQARTFARNNNQSKTRGEVYQAGREHLGTIIECVAKLSAAREELNKQISLERRNLILLAIAALGAVATIVGTILTFLAR